MKNYVQEGKVLEFTVPSGGVVSGQPVLIGNTFGIATADYAESTKGQFVVEGVFTLTKVTTDTFVEGQLIYWDNSAKKVTETPNSNYKIGISTEVAGSSATTAPIRLNGVATVAESA